MLSWSLLLLQTRPGSGGQEKRRTTMRLKQVPTLKHPAALLLHLLYPSCTFLQLPCSLAATWVHMCPGRCPPRAQGTYKGQKSCHQKDADKEIFKLLQHQLPEGLSWWENMKPSTVSTQNNPRPQGFIPLRPLRPTGARPLVAAELLQCCGH